MGGGTQRVLHHSFHVLRKKVPQAPAASVSALGRKKGSQHALILSGGMKKEGYAKE